MLSLRHGPGHAKPVAVVVHDHARCRLVAGEIDVNARVAWWRQKGCETRGKE
jgi:hypothetical protein